MAKHMRACVRNIPANIAEGFGRFHYQESMQFYRIARGSLAELKSDVYCSFDRHYITTEDLDLAIGQINKVGMLLNGFIKSTIKIKNHTSNK
jgi:four helix bundle protein